MDTMYPKKAKAEQKTANAAKNKNTKHISDNYNAKAKPRPVSSELSERDKKIKSNLKKINSEFVDAPLDTAVVKYKKTEDSGAKIITKRSAVKAPVPIAVIAGSIIVTAIVMYSLTLSAKISECKTEISKIDNQISELQAESIQLTSKLETKYDLNEIQRIATEEYGMVAADSLPKKYLKVSREGDYGESLGSEEESGNGLSNLLSGFAAAIRSFLE